MSALAEKYASHLISQCPAEVKDTILKFEKEEMGAKGAVGKDEGGGKAEKGQNKNTAEKNAKGKSQ